jgi:hypothetical protein
MNAASAATQNPDGLYAVDISTRQGDCDKAYHWMISVPGGRVNSVGATPMAASGQVPNWRHPRTGRIRLAKKTL